MLSLTRNLMIRSGMFPRNEGLRLHFIKYQASRLFSALAASSNLVIMQNKQRLESLKNLAPIEAVIVFLDGDFGMGDEPALISAIRKDTRILLSDNEIIDAVCDAMDEAR
jgi:hypothetical protein